jgi:hypothetical protein
LAVPVQSLLVVQAVLHDCPLPSLLQIWFAPQQAEPH